MAHHEDTAIWSIPRDELPTRLPGSRLIVVMHGYGSHEDDLTSLFPLLGDGSILVSLRAPHVAPAPIINGFAWFHLGSPGDPATDQVSAAATGVLDWLTTVTERFGAPSSIIGLGFSQGGALALQLLRIAPERITAAVNLSGFSASGVAAGDGTLAADRPPVFWGRDEADPVIPASAVDRTTAFLADHSSLEARLYSGISHGINAAEISDVVGFINRVAPIDLSQR